MVQLVVQWCSRWVWWVWTRSDKQLFGDVDFFFWGGPAVQCYLECLLFHTPVVIMLDIDLDVAIFTLSHIGSGTQVALKARCCPDCVVVFDVNHNKLTT